MPLMRINDIDLSYDTAGQGPPLLFIHGLGSSGRDWEYQIPFFSARYQTITIDLRGHGSSTFAAGPYSIALFAEDLAELIQELKVGQVHIVGISMGGMIGMQMAADFPNLCQSLTSINCKADYRLRSAADLLVAGRRLFFIFFLGMKGLGKHLSTTLFPKPEQENLRQKFIQRWSENTLFPYLKSLKAIGSWSINERLQEISCPTLLISADHDYTPASDKELIAARIQNAQVVVIKDSRHATPVERPDEFNQTLLAFLDHFPTKL